MRRNLLYIAIMILTTNASAYAMGPMARNSDTGRANMIIDPTFNQAIGTSHNMRNVIGPQIYRDFAVDTSMDIFINPARFRQMTGGMEFVDQNGDGIIDYAQNTPFFQQLGMGPFKDRNGDSIHDEFQTFQFYRALGMDNFVDVDGDGICDNYEENPFNHETP